MSKTSIDRRTLLAGAVGIAALAGTRRAFAFGEEGAFNPRILLVGDGKLEGARATAPSRWADEVAKRTSAPARLRPTKVRADANELMAEPFAIWTGADDVPPLLSKELAQLRRFFALGGILFVDDQNPQSGAFSKAAQREIARVLPDDKPIAIGAEHVVFRTFYLLKRATGRVEGPEKLLGVVRGGTLQVIFTSHDLLGALAREANGVSPIEVVPGGEEQRETAIRLAVNVALYVLCSNYKDDQVHAELIMRRRGGKKK